MSKKSGNPKNRQGGRVTPKSDVPKHIRQQAAEYKRRGGTLEELQAIEKALDERIAYLEGQRNG